MNAIFVFFMWLAGLFGGHQQNAQGTSTHAGVKPSGTQIQGVHIINVNPRTVVALEDTHFTPAR